MRSALPKVLHEAAGQPLLSWVLASARSAGCKRILVVVGHGAEEVRAACAGTDIEWVEQTEQRGTGHALARVEPAIREPARLLVLSGDVPLVRPATLTALLERAATSWGTMATAELAEPRDLGRVEVGAGNLISRIVEASDAPRAALANRRINAGLYVLPAPEIFAYLKQLTATNARGELYLTDAVNAAVADGHAIAALELADPDEALGVNDRRDLARVHRALIARRLAALAEAGVTVLDPATTTVEPQVAVGADTVLHPGVSLTGRTRIGERCTVGQGAWLRDTTLGAEVVVEPYSVLDGATIEDGCRVGPFARLRPGAVLRRGAKVGNFVEVKNAELGAGAKANHLAYLGDATVGERANIGAGTVTCNYDGEAKHPTTIGAGAFIGSDTMLVAPVTVGEEATTGAGSVITQDVPPGALAVERSRQRTVRGWKARRRRRE
jgi:bifunctional UDP-N-acetylglucosamine pyrophosphorylase/glucosamine-1-phosphate N-acetyltransferase